MIYCFLNSEVREKIKLHFERIQTRNDITRNYNSQAAIMTLTVVAGDGTTTSTKARNNSNAKSEKISLLISANGEHRKVKMLMNRNNVIMTVRYGLHLILIQGKSICFFF